MDVAKLFFRSFDKFVSKMKMNRAYKRKDKVIINSLKKLPDKKELTKDQKRKYKISIKALLERKFHFLLMNIFTLEQEFIQKNIYPEAYIMLNSSQKQMWSLIAKPMQIKT